MQTMSSSRPMDSFFQVIKSNEFPLVDRAYFNTGETPQPNALLVFISSTNATLLMAHFRRVGRCRSFYISCVIGDGLTVRSIPSAKDASSERTNERNVPHNCVLRRSRARFKILSPQRRAPRGARSAPVNWQFSRQWRHPSLAAYLRPTRARSRSRAPI